MTQRTDVDRGREIIERWCVLAEQRLNYLMDLLETGRWRRFHTESDLVENIEEARTAVETWRLLASREATPDNRAIDLSWLGRAAIPLAERDIVKDARGLAPSMVAGSLQQTSRASGGAASRPAATLPAVQPGWEQALDVTAMQERYPLLRNAL